MTLSRRKFLAAGTALAAAGLTGCGSRSSLGGSNELSMWTWTGSVNDGLIGQAEKAIPGADGMKLAMTRIGSNYKTKVLTALAGKSLVPDIVAINDDVATYFPNADQFHDLYELGAKELEKDFLPWKWKWGVTPAGKMLGYPMDTGPTALFYRTDIFQKAGIDVDPGAVAQLAPDWDTYIALGKKLKQAVPGSAITDNISGIYSYRMAQQPKRYMTPDGKYIGDQDHVRQAFDLAVRVIKEGLSANAQNSTDKNAVVTNGKLVAYNAAVWWAQLGPKNAAPKTKGLWKVTAAPGGAGNRGGSFLGITKYCKNPKAAFAFISWLESAKNQAEAFLDPVLFPSTPASYTDSRLSAPDPFFGGQRIVDVFADSAKKYPGAFFSPYDSIIDTPIGAELVNVEAAGKNPDQAWADAQHQIERELTRAGAI
ncbi:ABC transporter substrate-binding protein [Kribbella solani]|uniref:Cellobiose transport system substrate-binding protein n=1 Tax=Kribbella solani TaxID=236067 RepID=A0A841DHQ5_9ACTN|nr:extracellular solute-binding protein [Kribbella solani]MBB5977009.1 cellobiose transport system substrate-binding protein [Kribbella solani]MDX2968003.1 extracellular solute-binding protein [Kribbella solani]MDX3002296.1 extracellular solute-binding protein [Kribbella solani]